MLKILSPRGIKRIAGSRDPLGQALGAALGRMLGHLGTALVLGRSSCDSKRPWALWAGSWRLLGPSWAPPGPETRIARRRSEPRGRAPSPRRFESFGWAALKTRQEGGRMLKESSKDTPTRVRSGTSSHRGVLDENNK
eukprot:4350750-Pyramimonas_sp.AAC.1